MSEIKETIQNINTEIDIVVELFYQQKIQEAYQKLDILLKKMMEMVVILEEYQHGREDEEIDANGLLLALKEALSAIEQKDAVLVADVLKYEIQEKLNDMAGAIEI